MRRFLVSILAVILYSALAFSKTPGQKTKEIGESIEQSEQKLKDKATQAKRKFKRKVRKLTDEQKDKTDNTIDSIKD